MAGTRGRFTRVEIGLIASILLTSSVLGVVIWRLSSGGSEPTAAFSPQGGFPLPSRSHRPSPSPFPTPSPASPGKLPKVTIPAADFKQNTWGYVGCSNTHDTLAGYQMVSSLKLFWPYAGYRIEGQTVDKWENLNSPVWGLFAAEKQKYNGGKDPPVIWIQACVDLDPSEGNYHPVTLSDVEQMVRNVRAAAPKSILFVSPLQSYSPPTLCPKMGPGGGEIAQMTAWMHTVVAEGLAYPGPGVDGIPNLGPLTVTTAFTDGCHPNGGDHGPGPGIDFLGGQLAAFFDNLPKS